MVHDDHWFDFGSGNGGDVIDLAALLLYNGDKGQAIRELGKLTGATVTEDCSGWVDYTNMLCSQIESYHQHLTDRDREYLHQRGITDDTINRVKLGRTEDGRLCFPYWKNGYICYYATRALPGSAMQDKKYMKMQIPANELCEHTVWGLHTLDRDPKRELLVIAEGAFDALSFDQDNYSVISAITGRFSKEQIPTLISIAKSFKQVFLVFDNDKVSHAGEAFTLSMTKLLTEYRIPCIVGKVPPTYKDISEYYADGGKLSEIIDSATDGLEFLAANITDPTDLEAFAKKVCRYKTAMQVDAFFKPIQHSEKFDADQLKSLIKDCKKAPPDDVIAKEVLAKNKLLYNPNTSFYKYNGKCWDAMTDTAVEGIICEKLGMYATGPRLSSILRVIKGMVVTDQLFNRNPVMNFINGTLELSDTEPYYTFRGHQETDYCTYCLEYPYTPGATSTDWINFIESVTDGDNKRASLLQEFAGYVLYPDNQYQKCLALVGNGANGKSIYFNALTNVFGRVNVTNIGLSKLAQDFQAIHLLGSMLNISAEVKSSVNGAEETFKQILGGDEIFACYKGKDYIKFKPRAKMILSLNNYPETADKSDAFARRLAFVEFPLKFVECPSLPNERLLDRSLEFKFADSTVLPGIFNWVLDGYVLLKNCGSLTETNEQEEKLEEFKEDSDPTLVFAREVHIEDRITYAELYAQYCQWCLQNNYKPEPSRKALRFIGKHFEKYQPQLEQGKCNGERVWKIRDLGT
jgi:P4 family phage/plasmid primase-like protien